MCPASMLGLLQPKHGPYSCDHVFAAGSQCLGADPASGRAADGHPMTRSSTGACSSGSPLRLRLRFGRIVRARLTMLTAWPAPSAMSIFVSVLSGSHRCHKKTSIGNSGCYESRAIEGPEHGSGQWAWLSRESRASGGKAPTRSPAATVSHWSSRMRSASNAKWRRLLSGVC
jgi:hypothetical protein